MFLDFPMVLMIFPAINHHFLGFPSLPPCHSSTMFHVSTASHDYPITPWSVSHCILMTYNCCAWNPIYSCSGWWLTYPSAKYESQLGLLFPIYGKITNVPKHQPAMYNWALLFSIRIKTSLEITSTKMFKYSQPRLAILCASNGKWPISHVLWSLSTFIAGSHNAWCLLTFINHILGFPTWCPKMLARLRWFNKRG